MCLPSRVIARSMLTWSSANAAAPVGERAKRVTRGVLGRVASQTPVPTAAPTTTAAAVGITRRRQCERRVRRCEGARVLGCSAASEGSVITNSATDMSDMRSRRSFARQRWINIRTCEGTSAGSAFHSGALFSTFASVSGRSSPAKARRPVNISYRTAPNAQMSDRLSAGLPRACSGAI